MIIKVIHVVFLSEGANASTQTGRKMARITWAQPERNLAAASSLNPKEKVKARRARLCTPRHPIKAIFVGTKSSKGIAIKLPTVAPR